MTSSSVLFMVHRLIPIRFYTHYKNIYSLARPASLLIFSFIVRFLVIHTFFNWYCTVPRSYCRGPRNHMGRYSTIEVLYCTSIVLYLDRICRRGMCLIIAEHSCKLRLGLLYNNNHYAASSQHARSELPRARRCHPRGRSSLTRALNSARVQSSLPPHDGSETTLPL
jgi:hypothetical protein